MSRFACAWLSLICIALVGSTLAQTASNSKSRTLPGVAAQSEPAPNNPVKGPDGMDQQFMKDAAVGGMAEIQLGQMAQSKATNSKVKSFGERMIKDHSTADDRLKNLAEQQHVGLPTELDPKHKKARAMLSKKSGAEFDKDYMLLMVQEHQKAIQKFQHEAKTSTDPTLKSFAQDTLPVLQSHLKEAQQIQSELSGK